MRSNLISCNFFSSGWCKLVDASVVCCGPYGISFTDNDKTVQVMQRLIDLEALQPTGDLSSVYTVQIEWSTNYLCLWSHFSIFYLFRWGDPFSFSWTICWASHQTSSRLWLPLVRCANIQLSKCWKLGFVMFHVIFIINSSVGVWQDLFAIAQDQPFRFPSTFTFVLRAFSTLEGWSHSLLLWWLNHHKNLKPLFFIVKRILCFEVYNLTNFNSITFLLLTEESNIVSGIGYTLDPDFSFVKIAAPYAQVCLCSSWIVLVYNVVKWSIHSSFWLSMKVFLVISVKTDMCRSF